MRKVILVVVKNGRERGLAIIMRGHLVSDDADDERTTFVDETERFERRWSSSVMSTQWLGEWHHINDPLLLGYLPVLGGMDDDEKCRYIKNEIGWPVIPQPWRAVYGYDTLKKFVEKNFGEDESIVMKDDRIGRWVNERGKFTFWLLDGWMNEDVELEDIDDEIIGMIDDADELKYGTDHITDFCRKYRHEDIAVVLVETIS